METESMHEGSQNEFRETLVILWRRKVLLLVTAALVTLTSVFMSARGTPVFESGSLVVIRPLVPPGAFESGSGGGGGPLGLDVSTKDERHIAKSSSVVNVLRESLKLSEDEPIDVTVEIVSEHLLRFIAKADTGERAARLANAHSRAYITYRRETTERALQEIIERSKVRVDALAKDLTRIDNKILNLSEDLGSLIGIDKPGRTITARRASLSAQILQLNSIRSEKMFQLTSVRTRYEDANASAGRSSGGGEIVEKAEVPLDAASPKPVRAGIIGLIFGLGLGVALSFLRNHFDARIRSMADASQALGADLLGVIPRSPRWRKRKAAYLDSIADPGSPTAESYRTLRQALIRSGIGRDLKTILVTSGGRRAGKSALAANLGVQFARAGIRTVVVSADLRRPRVHEFFGMPNTVGVSELVRGQEGAWALPPTDVPRLWLLPAGEPAENPSEFLDGPEMRSLMERLAPLADVIIIDAPALSAGADAATLSQYADVTLLAMRQSKARADGTISAVRELSQVGASRIGAVLTVAEGPRRSYRRDRKFLTEVVPEVNGYRSARSPDRDAPETVDGDAPETADAGGHGTLVGAVNGNGNGSAKAGHPTMVEAVAVVSGNGDVKPRARRVRAVADTVTEQDPENA